MIIVKVDRLKKFVWCLIFITGITFGILTSAFSADLLIDDFNDAAINYNSLGYWTDCWTDGGAVGHGEIKDENGARKFQWDNNDPKWKEGFWYSNLHPNGNGRDISTYGFLSFKIKGNSGGERFDVELQDMPHGISPQYRAKLKIEDYINVTKEWQTVSIPIDDFINNFPPLNLLNARAISFSFYRTASGIVYFDDLKFTGNYPCPKPQSTGNINVSNRQLLVDGSPYQIKGVDYGPVEIGGLPSDQSPTNNGIYQRDFPLIKQMNANTIRTFAKVNQALLETAGEYGLMVCAGFPIGITTSNPGSVTETEWRQKKLDEFASYVKSLPDRSSLLMWVIGNEENLYIPEENLCYWFTLVNEMAKKAYEIEGSNYHPVAVVILDWKDKLIIGDNTHKSTDKYMNYLDIWGINSYHGKTFGGLFEKYKPLSSKPLWVSEFGIDAWYYDKNDVNFGYEQQNAQVEWDTSLWNEIANNRDVCIGGSVFEFCDEWWKHEDVNPWIHDKGSRDGYPRVGPDGWDDREWWGLLERKKNNVSRRDLLFPRKAYFTFVANYGSETVVEDFQDISDWYSINGLKEYTKSDNCIGGSYSLKLSSNNPIGTLCGTLIRNLGTAVNWSNYQALSIRIKRGNEGYGGKGVYYIPRIRVRTLGDSGLDSFFYIINPDDDNKDDHSDWQEYYAKFTKPMTNITGLAIDLYTTGGTATIPYDVYLDEMNLISQNLNSTPVITANNQEILVGEKLEITVTANDSNLDDTVFLEVGNLPTWLTVENNQPGNSASMKIVGNPTLNQVGKYEVLFVVTDDGTPKQRNEKLIIIQVQKPPSLTLTTPNGGESWVVGNTETITWDSTGTITSVKLEYSKDNFVSNINTIIASTPNNGSYSWTIPNDPSATVKVRVSDAAIPGVNDVSDTNFEIQSAPSLTLTSPNGGEAWEGGTGQNITWTSTGAITNVKLEYSMDNFATVTTIIFSTPNDGIHPWTIPNAPSATVKVRISDVSNPSINDVSNDYFEIHPDITPPSPPTNIKIEDLRTGGTLRITWTKPTDSDFSHIHIYCSTSENVVEILKNKLGYEPQGNNNPQYDHTGLTNRVRYYYILRSVDTNNNESKNTTDIYGRVPNGIPTCVIVYPNPFKQSQHTMITFEGSGVPFATIKIYNIAGELVKTIVETEGKSRVYWDATNVDNKKVANGIYIYATKNPIEKNTGRIAIIK